MPRSFKYGWAHVASPVVSDLCLGLTSTTSEKQSTDSRILSLSASSSTCCVLNEASHVFGVVRVSGMTVRERARHDHKYVPVRHGTTK